jgi:hypothetical protein
MYERLWVPSPLRGEGQDEGDQPSFVPILLTITLTLTLSLAGRGEKAGRACSTVKVRAKHYCISLPQGESGSKSRVNPSAVCSRIGKF